ncbi:MAG: endopeptidase La [Ruminococcaceae bacterium]|nr:endopeptidase La [Oscillospiraceae bacterium]
MSEIILSTKLPILALRGITVFPGLVTHFDVGRRKSIRALEEAMNGNQDIFLVTQKDIAVADPQQKDLHQIGTLAHIKQLLKMPGDVVRVLVEGTHRAQLFELSQTEPFLAGSVETLPDQKYAKDGAACTTQIRLSHQLYERYCDLVPKHLQENLVRLTSFEDPGYIADFIAQHSTIHFADKQKVLEQLHPVRRLTLVNKLLTQENEVLQMENDLHEKVHENMNKGQRDYYLREQLKAIQAELDGDEESELQNYENRIRALHLPEENEQRLLKEVTRLGKQHSGSSESAVIRNYLDMVLELPWNEETKERVDVKAARKLLDRDHFGMEKVKERILEILSVKKLAPELPGQIICLVGPPGVGKTSIAISVAKCLNRKLARISLGGVHDEADIRGHRKTYVGAMPGRVIEAIRQAGSRNALVLLDEVDKMGSDYRGDPSAALLEVLDAEQNDTFRDHYVELPFDLSHCMFITTANTTDTIPRPLLDRMEVIELGSYTDEEKLAIAKDHLIPKQMKKHGLSGATLRISDEAIRETIACYTRESGVRNLERSIASICRKAAAKLVQEDGPKRVTVTGSNLEQFLGVRKYLPESISEQDQIGLVTGLAWTSVGGETLQVECNVLPGSGKLELTGNLGDVMKESVVAAMSYIRSRADMLNLPADFYKTRDIHVHFPEGAVPKDGPSAGITVCTAMVSALTGAPVRRDIAMTGEISIRGRVLPIGGLKEKTMAALRYGVRTVIIPKDNERDLQEIDPTVRRALNFIPVGHVDDVLSAALDLSKVSKPQVEEHPAMMLLDQKDGGTGLRQ